MATTQIKQWQTVIGVNPDGDFGPKTLEASLKIYEKAAGPKPPPVVAPPGGNPYSVKAHLLQKNGLDVSYKASPNISGLITPRLVVIHYTGTNSDQSALNWLTQSGSGVSAHLLITKTGVVWQMVPFNRRAWHAGKSEYEGQSDVNNFSIGIENTGLGDEWPEAQILANRQVIEAIAKVYGIVDVVGHDYVAIPAGRKVDPGPLYP